MIKLYRSLKLNSSVVLSFLKEGIYVLRACYIQSISLYLYASEVSDSSLAGFIRK